MAHWMDDASEIDHVEEIVLQPRVYFNYERDALYFREDWNRGVEGSWCSVSQFANLLNEGDLKRVKGVVFDVNARVCLLRRSEEHCHYPILDGWDTLETLYPGFEGVRLVDGCLISFRELERKDYKAFMRCYGKHPC